METHEKIIPRHIGLIMDGNRRFARRLMKEPWKGHEWGAKKVETVLDWCMDAGIKIVTLYALSIENLDRPKREFDMLMRIFEREFNKIARNEKIQKNKVRINVVGRTDLLPESVQKSINKAVNTTKNHDNFIVNFAIAYGGRQEIIDMTKKVASLVKSDAVSIDDLDAETIRKNLYTNGYPDPDLIIRTSGENRMSGFLLWQSAYSELYFCKKLWPEFEKRDFLKAIREFSRRDRRFGE